jgi:hypothetical protein
MGDLAKLTQKCAQHADKDIVRESLPKSPIVREAGSFKDLERHSVMGWPEVLTLSEVAEVLRCSKAHVCKIVNGQVAGTQQLPAINLGRRKLVRRSTLLSWLVENEQGARITSSLEIDAGRRA